MKEDTAGRVRREKYGNAGKRNAPENQNFDFQEGYAWGIAFALDRTGFVWEEDTITDIVGKLVRYGNISEKQEAFLGKLIIKIDERTGRLAHRAAEAEAAAPCPAGRIQVTGTVLSTKEQDSQRGRTLKMLVRSEAGFMVWVNCPPWGTERGTKVTFTATITPSDRDPKFGFGSRPTKFQVIQEVAAT